MKFLIVVASFFSFSVAAEECTLDGADMLLSSRKVVKCPSGRKIVDGDQKIESLTLEINDPRGTRKLVKVENLPESLSYLRNYFNWDSYSKVPPFDKIIADHGGAQVGTSIASFVVSGQNKMKDAPAVPAAPRNSYSGGSRVPPPRPLNPTPSETPPASR